jgi:hypothetical protein
VSQPIFKVCVTTQSSLQCRIARRFAGGGTKVIVIVPLF